MKKDPYDILGVTRDTPPREIRSAWLAAAKKHHAGADKGDPDALEQMKVINRAYDAICSGEAEKFGKMERPRGDLSEAFIINHGKTTPEGRPIWEKILENRVEVSREYSRNRWRMKSSFVSGGLAIGSIVLMMGPETIKTAATIMAVAMVVANAYLGIRINLGSDKMKGLGRDNDRKMFDLWMAGRDDLFKKGEPVKDQEYQRLIP